MSLLDKAMGMEMGRGRKIIKEGPYTTTDTTSGTRVGFHSAPHLKPKGKMKRKHLYNWIFLRSS